MPLPHSFQFSQGSLQAYVDCPRLFQLRYIEGLSWPAPEVEPALENERHLQLGSDFHRLVQQYLLGVSPERLQKIASQDGTLSQWWHNFKDFGAYLSGYAHFQEIALSAPIGGYRLVAKYDLIATPTSQKDGKFIIYDWKTSQKLPKREWQEKKLQTLVYPYLLVQAGAQLNGSQLIEPQHIEMVYWFSNFPTAPMKFIYNREQFTSNEEYISGLIAEIKTLDTGEAPKTENEKRCKFCVYRSLCNRGIKAGNLDELESEVEELDSFDFELDFKQIAEIEF